MPIHYFNLSATALHLISAGMLIYYFEEKNLLAIIALFTGIVFLSQNQPLQYGNKPQVKVVTFIAATGVVSFLSMTLLLIDQEEYQYSVFAGYFLALINFGYFLKAVSFLKSGK